MRIVVLGAGVQGTVFGVRLALAGHEVTLISTPQRARELREGGAAIQDLKSMQTYRKVLPVLDNLPSGFSTDICLVTVRREQIETVVTCLARAINIPRIVLLVNHANGSADLRNRLGPTRTVLAFPGIAGDREGGIIRFLDIPQQHTVVEESARDVASLFTRCGFPVDIVQDMDSWLQRHAVFITAIAGALYETECDVFRLAHNSELLRRFVIAVREGWKAQDRAQVGPAPLALRVMMCWFPTQFSTRYWSRLLSSPCGEIYFARHVRHAPTEMAALANDVRAFLHEGEALGLVRQLASIDTWCRKLNNGRRGEVAPVGE